MFIVYYQCGERGREVKCSTLEDMIQHVLTIGLSSIQRVEFLSDCNTRYDVELY